MTLEDDPELYCTQCGYGHDMEELGNFQGFCPGQVADPCSICGGPMEFDNASDPVELDDITQTL
tara:strand:- start:617 stop:808 length:192 start_codon:yes stop_codon:yes gene_type:complete